MSNKRNLKSDPDQPMFYQIRIKGHLSPTWAKLFEGMYTQPEDNGDTLITGPVVDQSALHGLLKKIRDFGIPLVSVIPVKFNETHSHSPKKGDTQ